VEIMARALGYSLEDFGRISPEGRGELRINSMCTVFAESEVVSLITKGAAREDIALALCRSAANKVLSMLRRVPCESDVVFAGGCARNNLLKGLLEAGAGKGIRTPETPEITGALGAALYAQTAHVQEG
nr:2-hydroxyglutaryl-CoA dehydratase [Nitrospiraceae bacterium]